MHKGFASTTDPFGLGGGLEEGTNGYAIRTEDINAQGVTKEVFVAAGLAIWLSSFVFPTGEGNTIGGEVLASMCPMAKGEGVTIGVSWAAYFMNMMDNISTHGKSGMSKKTTPLPLHYWMGWLSCYCPKSYPSRCLVEDARLLLLYDIAGCVPSGKDLKTTCDFFW